MFDFISQKFSSIFNAISGKNILSPEVLETAVGQIQEALLESDVPYNVVQDFTTALKKDLVGKKFDGKLKPDEYVMKVVYDQVLSFLGGKQTIAFSFQLPSVVMVMGLQGSGKTTTTGKLAHFVLKEAKLRNKQRAILVASVDFYRPAAVDQLEIVAGQVGCGFYRAVNTDPVQAAQEIYEYYKKEKYELLFLDTAGRLHVDTAMLEELRRIDALINPRYKILVLDAMTGQESLRVAQSFDEKVGFQSAILTKMDSDARGGAAFAFRYTLKKAIIFAGFGEKIDDLHQFFPDRIAQRILSMGDIQSLVEKANEKIKQSEQDKVYSSFMAGRLTLEDFAQQMDMVSRLGSLAQLSKYLPGMGTAISQDKLDEGEKEMKKFRAIIYSMTPQERVQTALIDHSRKTRIAKGAGVKVTDVTTLLERFEQAQQYVKLFKKSGPFKNFFR